MNQPTKPFAGRSAGYAQAAAPSREPTQLDRHRDAAVSSLISRAVVSVVRPKAPFAELVRLSRKSIADEMREAHRRRVGE